LATTKLTQSMRLASLGAEDRLFFIRAKVFHEPEIPPPHEQELRDMASNDKNPTLALSLLDYPPPLQPTRAKLGVWDKENYRAWGPTTPCEPNTWETIEVQLIGTQTNRGKIYVHVDPGFRGNLYIDRVEVIWGGPTETERMVEKVINKCGTNHELHSNSMRIKIIDARHLTSVDWGGAR